MPPPKKKFTFKSFVGSVVSATTILQTLFGKLEGKLSLIGNGYVCLKSANKTKQKH